MKRSEKALNCVRLWLIKWIKRAVCVLFVALCFTVYNKANAADVDSCSHKYTSSQTGKVEACLIGKYLEEYNSGNDKHTDFFRPITSAKFVGGDKFNITYMTRDCSFSGCDWYSLTIPVGIKYAIAPTCKANETYDGYSKLCVSNDKLLVSCTPVGGTDVLMFGSGQARTFNWTGARDTDGKYFCVRNPNDNKSQVSLTGKANSNDCQVLAVSTFYTSADGVHSGKAKYTGKNCIDGTAGGYVDKVGLISGDKKPEPEKDSNTDDWFNDADKNKDGVLDENDIDTDHDGFMDNDRNKDGKTDEHDQHTNDAGLGGDTTSSGGTGNGGTLPSGTGQDIHDKDGQEVGTVGSSCVASGDCKGFITRQYQDGISGVFTSGFNDIKKTALFSGLDKDRLTGKGATPKFTFDLTGFDKSLGTKEMSIPLEAYQFLKAILLLITAATCRRVIFGG